MKILKRVIVKVLADQEEDLLLMLERAVLGGYLSAETRWEKTDDAQRIE